MKKHPLQKLLEASDLEMDIRSYSGRGMFGRTCLGITGHLQTIIGQLMAIPLGRDLELTLGEIDQLKYDLQRGIAWDSMGLDSVVYFPNIPFVEDRILNSPDDEDDDDE